MTAPAEKSRGRGRTSAAALVFGDLWEYDPAPETADPRLQDLAEHERGEQLQHDPCHRVGRDRPMLPEQHADQHGHLVHTPAGSFLFEAREAAYTSRDLAAITMRARVLSGQRGYEIAPALCLADDRTVTLRRHAGVWIVSLERLGDWAGLQHDPEFV